MSLLVSVILVAAGVVFNLYPEKIGKRISGFYMKYPIIRYAPVGQFRIRPVFIRIFGVFLLIVGIYYLAILEW